MSFNFEVYSDASFGNVSDERKSVIAYVSIGCGAVISFKSFLNKCICISTNQAETIAVSEAGRESEWLRILLGELNLADDNPVKIWCDNQSTISIIKKPANFNGTKHIAIRHLYARELHEEGNIEIAYCATNKMIADALTKALPKAKFEEFRTAMGVTKIIL
jgi:hypothetical protein